MRVINVTDVVERGTRLVNVGAISLVTSQRTVDRPKLRAKVTDRLPGKSVGN